MSIDSLRRLRESEFFLGPSDHAARTIDPTGLPDVSAVEHIVVLLRENRSFDHYLGCYAQTHGNVEGPHKDASNPDPTMHTDIPRFHESRYCVANSNHEWSDVHLQLDHDKLDGFVAASNDDANYRGGARAMGFYDKYDLPLYYQLAETFAISDRYFASVPGPTHPNIAFYFHATACGFTEGIQDSRPALPGIPGRNISIDCGKAARSIFDLLDEAKPPISNRVYSFNRFPLEYLAASRFIGGYHGTVYSIEQFEMDVAGPNPSLPSVVFVEPTYNGIEHIENGKTVQNDEHPPYDIQLGQKFAYRIVKALLASPVWKSTVLFISWDEHGGYYDHVVPPRACRPDDTFIDQLDFRFGAGKLPLAIAAADFDHDGKTDLAAADGAYYTSAWGVAVLINASR